jgi:hypothetical protein
MQIARRMIRAGIVIETLLLLAGLSLVAEAFMDGTATYKLVNAGQSAEGAITGVENGGFSVNIQFTPSSGSTAVFQQDGFLFGSKTGEQVPVVYNLANPAEAVMNSFSALWFRPIIWSLAGFFLFMFSMRLRAKRSL